jgi:hypothetical protein
MLPWEYEAWQDSETNNWAVGISAALRTTDWAVMPADRRDRVYRNLAACAADFVQYMAGKGVTVPLVRISGAQARARVPGFCAHGDSGIARSDPGANFDWAKFFAYTAQALTGSLTYASESIKPMEWDEMASKDEVKQAAKEAIEGWAFSDGFKKPFDDGDVARSPIDFLKQLRAEQGGLIATVRALSAAVTVLASTNTGVTPEQVDKSIKDAVAEWASSYEPTIVKKEG